MPSNQLAQPNPTRLLESCLVHPYWIESSPIYWSHTTRSMSHAQFMLTQGITGLSPTRSIATWSSLTEHVVYSSLFGPSNTWFLPILAKSGPSYSEFIPIWLSYLGSVEVQSELIISWSYGYFVLVVPPQLYSTLPLPSLTIPYHDGQMLDSELSLSSLGPMLFGSEGRGTELSVFGDSLTMHPLQHQLYPFNQSL